MTEAITTKKSRWWLDQILEANDNYQILLDCIDHFEDEYQRGRKDVKLAGRLEVAASRLPALTEYHFSNQKEMEVILEFLNSKTRHLKAKHYRRFNEHYQKTLSQRDIERYIDGEEDVQHMEHLVLRFAALANRYSGIIKALETMGYQINNITRLRVAGLDDVEIN